MITILSACLLASIAGHPFSDTLDFEEFQKLHDNVKPTEEVWKTIPWHVDLKSAQKEASEKDKLLLIWAMDGHPLGCT